MLASFFGIMTTSFFESWGHKTIILMDTENDKSALVAEIKNFRKEIDALIQKADRLWLPDAVYHRQMGLVKTKLEEAKMWAGKVLEKVGNPFPPELADKADVQ